MECLKSSQCKLHAGLYNKNIEEELDWWIENIDTGERNIYHVQPMVIIETDASKGLYM